MGKRKIKLLMLGLMDRIEQINAILVEKNKYKNKKRISIYNSVNLTKKQVNDTESLYTENYGKKIPLIGIEAIRHIQEILTKIMYQSFYISQSLNDI